MPAHVRNFKLEECSREPVAWSFDSEDYVTQYGSIDDDEEDEEKVFEQVIHLVLRRRNEKKELEDIKFHFCVNQDTADQISFELVNEKLINPIDMATVSENLNKLLENNSISPITFQLVRSISLFLIICQLYITVKNNFFFL